MIQLAASVVANDPLLSQLKVPPTHAKAIVRRYVLVPAGCTLPSGYANVAANNTVEALYAYGTLDATSGAFVPTPAVVAVHTMVDLTGYTSPAVFITPDAENKLAAAKNLLNPQVVPTPGDPQTAITVLSKKPHDFKEVDLDALVAQWDVRLLGTVVPAPGIAPDVTQTPTLV